MTWPDLFLLCFLVGFFLSLFSVLTGHVHLHLHHGVHVPTHAGGHGHASGHAAQPGGKTQVSWLNMGTIAAFLAWFGGAGYLATRYYGALLLTALGIALLFGLAGGAAVFWFLAKVLMGRPEHLDPADYEMVGVLGTVSGSIRAGGTGEILFTQAGARKACGARSEGGEPIPNGTEVVVTKYDRGIAYVRRWDELTGSGYGSAAGGE